MRSGMPPPRRAISSRARDRLRNSTASSRRSMQSGGRGPYTDYSLSGLRKSVLRRGPRINAGKRRLKIKNLNRSYRCSSAANMDGAVLNQYLSNPFLLAHPMMNTDERGFLGRSRNLRPGADLRQINSDRPASP